MDKQRLVAVQCASMIVVELIRRQDIAAEGRNVLLGARYHLANQKRLCGEDIWVGHRETEM